MKRIVSHCEDVKDALVDIKALLNVDGRINMTNYILANSYLDKLIKMFEEAENEHI